jgi:hypothetical protein
MRCGDLNGAGRSVRGEVGSWSSAIVGGYERCGNGSDGGVGWIGELMSVGAAEATRRVAGAVEIRAG